MLCLVSFGMNKLENGTIERYLDMLASNMPTVITQMPVAKQALLIQLLNEYIQKSKLDVRLNTIDSNDLNAHYNAIIGNAQKLLMGDKFHEGIRVMLADELYDNLLLSSVDQEGAFRKMAGERLTRLKTTDSADELFDTTDEYFSAGFKCEQTIGSGKLRHLAIVTNAQLINDTELHKVVNTKIAIDGNHDGNTPARTMITNAKRLNTHENCTRRPLQDMQDFTSYNSNRYFKELLKL